MSDPVKASQPNPVWFHVGSCDTLKLCKEMGRRLGSGKVELDEFWVDPEVNVILPPPCILVS